MHQIRLTLLTGLALARLAAGSGPATAICRHVAYDGVFTVHQLADGFCHERTEGSADVPCRPPGMPSRAALKDLRIPCEVAHA